MNWDDIPQKPWPEATQPPPEVLADWLRSLSFDQLVWVLERQQGTWRLESRCFSEKHDERIRYLEDRLLNIQTVLQLHGIFGSYSAEQPSTKSVQQEYKEAVDALAVATRRVEKVDAALRRALREAPDV